MPTASFVADTFEKAAQNLRTSLFMEQRFLDQLPTLGVYHGYALLSCVFVPSLFGGHSKSLLGTLRGRRAYVITRRIALKNPANEREILYFASHPV